MLFLAFGEFLLDVYCPACYGTCPYDKDRPRCLRVSKTIAL